MKVFFITSVLSFCFYSVFSQELARNTIYLEVGGATGVGSLNYERLFLLKNNNYAISFRSGLTYISFLYPGEQKIYGIPVGTSFLVRGRKLCFEAGAACSANISELNYTSEFPGNYSKSLILFYVLRMGIRHQPEHSGIFWNILFQPTLGYSKSLISPDKHYEGSSYYSYLPWLSLGIGYSF